MTDLSKLTDAIFKRDAARVRSLIVGNEFVVLSLPDGGESTDDDHGQGVAALTAQLEDFDVLVAFTSETKAGVFVREQDDLFDPEEEVDGIIVEGNTLLEHLPDGFGLLLDPENEESSVIDPTLAVEVVQAG